MYKIRCRPSNLPRKCSVRQCHHMNSNKNYTGWEHTKNWPLGMRKTKHHQGRKTSCQYNPATVNNYAINNDHKHSHSHIGYQTITKNTWQQICLNINNKTTRHKSNPATKSGTGEFRTDSKKNPDLEVS